MRSDEQIVLDCQNIELLQRHLIESYRQIDELKAENEQMFERELIHLKLLKESQERLNKLFVAGSDGCSKCESGRVTYWKKTMLCFKCELPENNKAGE